MTPLPLLWALAATLLPWLALAHPGHARPDGLYLAIKIEADHLRVGLNLPPGPLTRLTGSRLDLTRVPPRATLVALRDQAVALIEGLDLTVDGAHPTPEVGEVALILRVPPIALRGAPSVPGLSIHPGPEPALRAQWRVPAHPRRALSVRWGAAAAFDGPDDSVLGTVFVGDAVEPFHLSAAEPAFTWHAPQTTAAPTPDLAPRPPPPALLPIATTLIALLGLALTVALRRRRSAALAVLLATGCTTLAGRDWRPLDVAAWWSAGGLDEAGARAVFTRLHAGLYAAFDQQGDEAIYDALAEVADGPLLDWLYQQVFDSLVLRDEGGAVAQIERVTLGEVRSAAAPTGAGPNTFAIEATWTVVGEVTHYGHTHRRTTRYRGRFTIAPRDAGWRVVALEILDHRRIDAETPAELLK